MIEDHPGLDTFTPCSPSLSNQHSEHTTSQSGNMAMIGTVAGNPPGNFLQRPGGRQVPQGVLGIITGAGNALSAPISPATISASDPAPGFINPSPTL